ncbi:hypothetical protein CRYUN_Cryun06bG0112200 [Craigia yunnanensis]
MGANSSTPIIVEMKSTSQWRAKLEASKQICFTNRFHLTIILMKNNVWKQDVAREFKVEAMLTFVFVKKGKEVDRMVGARKAELQKMIEKHRI